MLQAVFTPSLPHLATLDKDGRVTFWTPHTCTAITAPQWPLLEEPSLYVLFLPREKLQPQKPLEQILLLFGAQGAEIQPLTDSIADFTPARYRLLVSPCIVVLPNMLPQLCIFHNTKTLLATKVKCPSTIVSQQSPSELTNLHPAPIKLRTADAEAHYQATKKLTESYGHIVAIGTRKLQTDSILQLCVWDLATPRQLVPSPLAHTL